ncbi:MAG: YvcK family protein [Acidobacteriota bacterium]|jgi:uncharacterized cofD-like protein
MAGLGKVVALGGGTGLPALLAAIRPSNGTGVAPIRDVTAVVTVSDSGGSSGRLRRDLGTLAPGDIRNCLVALSDAPETLRKLFQYRFSQGELEGHSLGNLLIVALAQVTGDFASAVSQMHDILAIRGKIYPSTLENVELVADYEDGSRKRGEAAITKAGKAIRGVALDPPGCRALPEACAALEDADLILFGPGSLYTSVLPNLLVGDIAKAIRASRARKVYICNLVTQPGETSGYSAGRHVRAIVDHCGTGLCDTILCNSAPLPDRVREAYTRVGSAPVELDAESIRDLGVSVVAEDLLAEGPYARHDPAKLKGSLERLLRTAMETP